LSRRPRFRWVPAVNLICRSPLSLFSSLQLTNQGLPDSS
jgi:hypothetical protein